ncbi:PilZ domain-containing protein [Erythrobacter mangrovi]|uniref:PilZ domain-containing protein n=1 Tax=Erythrobacter mangrovi TaxID=2739433 RepID=A0A7D3XPC2_9SPHN|nr:PilZ domain-containing protein [Erythrobacter mangrovi]QKG70814.1 PilZ domain-containing protein [Erythrobacter mangrovi]
MEFATAYAMNESSSATASDQRGAPRFTSLIRAAKLVCGQGEFVCVVRDVSATGVSLRTFHGLPTDQQIALELQNGEIYEMTQVRADGFDGSYRFESVVPVERLVHENWAFPKRQLRLNLAMPLTVSTLSQKANAYMLNLSQQGARIECESVFAIDQTVRIENEFMPEIRAKVRWRRDANYGLAFDTFFSLREFALLAARVQCPLLLNPEDRR